MYAVSLNTTEPQRLALTFDDGPDSHYTPQIIAVLEAYRVPATFFCVGKQVRKHPEVVRLMVQGGHTVANHTWSHPHLNQLDDPLLIDEIRRTHTVIVQETGVQPELMRPPFGDLDDAQRQILLQCGYQVVLWDIDSQDWTGADGPTVAAHIIGQLGSNKVILCHSAPHSAGTLDALPFVITVARALGYIFVPLVDIVGHRPYWPS